MKNPVLLTRKSDRQDRKSKNFPIDWKILSLIISLFSPGLAVAQVVPDTTLPTRSTVTQQGNIITIDGGTTAESNLFHSFSEFSVITGASARFNNPPSINNIITRVTGDNISNIDGLIEANGVANLFLLNPNGIVFGNNAAIDIGGSFLASTANAVEFADGLRFSAIDSQSNPLLSISVPIGLQLSTGSGTIQVRSGGHQIPAFPVFFDLIEVETNPGGLRVNPGQTLALVGGDINLEGGVLAADSGRVELGAIETGVVAFEPPVSGTGGWTLSYDDVSGFRNIALSQESIVDASGIGGGSVQLQGNRIELSEASLVLIVHESTQLTDSIRVNATELVRVESVDLPIPTVLSGFYNDSLGSAQGGAIRVSTPRYEGIDQGILLTRVFGEGRGGDIVLDAPDSIFIEGGTDGSSLITSFSIGSAVGDTGDIEISTGTLTALEGGGLGTQTLSFGNAGRLTLRATDSINVIGVVRDRPLSSSIGSVSVGLGNTGPVTISAERVIVRDGGNIITSAFHNGDAGSLTIDAEYVEVSGTSEGALSIGGGFSSIASAAEIQSPDFIEFFGTPPVPGGNTGNITINADRFRAIDGGNITVAHEGTGDAGSISINAGSIVLDNEGSLLGSTASGAGGNIALNAGNIRLSDRSLVTAESGGMGSGGNITISGQNLSLFNNSTIAASTTQGDGGNVTIDANTTILFSRGLISAQAGGMGDGGDISINTDTLVGLFNSDIVASAFQGNGGNITIVADAVFGLQPRSSLTPFNDINASSEFGIDGTIEINTPDIDNSDVFGTLSAAVIDAGDTVAYCAGLTRYQVVFTGRGGIPENPRLFLEHPIALEDLGSDEPLAEAQMSGGRPVEVSEPFIEAGGWIEGSNGVELVALPRVADADAWMRQATCEDANAVSQR